MKNLLIILFVLFIWISISKGEIFKWVDKNGIVHFTDDISKIPVEYIKNIEKLEDISVNEVRFEKESKKKDDVYKDILGRGEDYWRKRVNELRLRLMQLQEMVEALRLRYNELTEKFNESKNSIEKSNTKKERDSVKIEMDKLRSEINEVKIELEKKIPEEVRLFKAKEEWIK